MSLGENFCIPMLLTKQAATRILEQVVSDAVTDFGSQRSDFQRFRLGTPRSCWPSNIVKFVAAAPETWFSKRADAQLHLGTFYIARGQTLVKLDKFKQHKQDVDFDLKSARRQL